MGCLIEVPTGNKGIKLRWGKFAETVEPGANFIWPCFERIDLVDTKIQQTTLDCKTKTLDNVFINIQISLQY